ncbi:hypothetical protein ABOONEI_2288 [Aciduliprofundum boonei T469]|nr:hypothetical protein ABOONEI_2288 [Aciduliprofundum boonei T469]
MEERENQDVKELLDVLTNEDEDVEVRRDAGWNLLKKNINNKENWWEMVTEDKMRELLDIAKNGEEDTLMRGLVFILLRVLLNNGKHAVLDDSDVRELIEIAKNEEEENHIREDSLGILSLLAVKNYKLDVITEDDVRELIRIAEESGESKMVRESALEYLSMLVKNGIAVISDGELGDFIDIVESDDEPMIRLMFLDILSFLADSGRCKEVLQVFMRRIESEIERVDKNLNEWEESTLKWLEELEKEGKLRNRDKVVLLVLRLKRDGLFKKMEERRRLKWKMEH